MTVIQFDSHRRELERLRDRIAQAAESISTRTTG
jgi:hypothetical protein